MNVIPLQFANGRTRAATRAFDRKSSLTASTGVLSGIAIVAIVPAAFWTGLIWSVGYAFNVEIGLVPLATLGTGIAVFLSIVCSAVIAAN